MRIVWSEIGRVVLVALPLGALGSSFMLLWQPKPVKQTNIARERMAAMPTEEWAELYHQAVAIVDMTSGDIIHARDAWPDSLVRLNPQHVFPTRDFVHLIWGSSTYDNFVWMYLVWNTGAQIVGGPEGGTTPGVWIIDTQGRLPHNPFKAGGADHFESAD